MAIKLIIEIDDTGIESIVKNKVPLWLYPFIGLKFIDKNKLIAKQLVKRIKEQFDNENIEAHIFYKIQE